jgi:hypothetical protein
MQKDSGPSNSGPKNELKGNSDGGPSSSGSKNEPKGGSGSGSSNNNPKDEPKGDSGGGPSDGPSDGPSNEPSNGGNDGPSSNARTIFSESEIITHVEPEDMELFYDSYIDYENTTEDILELIKDLD